VNIPFPVQQTHPGHDDLARAGELIVHFIGSGLVVLDYAGDNADGALLIRIGMLLIHKTSLRAEGGEESKRPEETRDLTRSGEGASD